MASRRRAPATSRPIKNEEVEHGEDGADTGVSLPPTFEGRLRLKDFLYASPSESGLRRSPRRAASASVKAEDTIPASPSSAATPSRSIPVKSPKKRSLPPPPSTVCGRSKRIRPRTGYAPPSTYAHLPVLPDAIGPNLLVQFIGLNPGIQTARSGHAFAHPSNLFWKLLYSSGVTPRLCRPEEDRQMPELYSLGLTNIVARPSRNGSELSNSEMDDGVALLEEKARRWRPEVMCVVGKSIWESIWRVRHGRAVGKAFKYGWQDDTENMGVIKGQGDEAWSGAKVFVASSTSGLAASMSPAEKERIWAELGTWVKTRRVERAGG